MIFSLTYECGLLMLLCCEGFLLLAGLIVMVGGKFQWLGKQIDGKRRWALGVALFIQAPLAIALGIILLGDTPPGSINGAEFEAGRTRLLATLAEWGVVLVGVLVAFFAWLSAPSVKKSKKSEEG